MDVIHLSQAAYLQVPFGDLTLQRQAHLRSGPVSGDHHAMQHPQKPGDALRVASRGLASMGYLFFVEGCLLHPHQGLLVAAGCTLIIV